MKAISPALTAPHRGASYLAPAGRTSRDVALQLVADAVAFQDAVASGRDTLDLVERFQTYFAIDDAGVARAVLSGQRRAALLGTTLVIEKDDRTAASAPVALQPHRVASMEQAIRNYAQARAWEGQSHDEALVLEFMTDFRAWARHHNVNLVAILDQSFELDMLERHHGLT